jgi:hypothetical protein
MGVWPRLVVSRAQSNKVVTTASAVRFLDKLRAKTKNWSKMTILSNVILLQVWPEV